MPAACLWLFCFEKPFLLLTHPDSLRNLSTAMKTHQSHALVSERGNVPAVHPSMQALFLLWFLCSL